MYTVSKGPSKIVAKTRRGLSQNFEKFETIKESGKRNNDANSPEKLRYKWLDRTFPGTAKNVILKKLFIDQFVLTPYLLTVFFTGMSLMEGREDLTEELKHKFLPTFERSCMFWLPAQVFNFVLISPRFRVIYMGVCGFIWVNILCWIKRQRTESKEQSTLTEN